MNETFVFIIAGGCAIAILISLLLTVKAEINEDDDLRKLERARKILASVKSPGETINKARESLEDAESALKAQTPRQGQVITTTDKPSGHAT